MRPGRVGRWEVWLQRTLAFGADRLLTGGRRSPDRRLFRRHFSALPHHLSEIICVYLRDLRFLRCVRGWSSCLRVCDVLCVPSLCPLCLCGSARGDWRHSEFRFPISELLPTALRHNGGVNSPQREVDPRATVFLLGFATVIAQALLLREAMAAMGGSELAWGTVMALWLAGVSVGARIGGQMGLAGSRAPAPGDRDRTRRSRCGRLSCRTCPRRGVRG